MSSFSTQDIVLVALFAAIMTVLGVFPPITLPVIGVPITAQSLGVMLAGGILGAKRGALSMILFLALVAIGLPLLAGGHGGFSVFLGASGGFLIGWIVAAFVIGKIVERFWEQLNFWIALVACIVGGIVLLYLIGIPWISFAAKISIWKATIGSLLFIPGDLVKAVIASAIIVAVAKAYPIINRKVTTDTD